MIILYPRFDRYVFRKCWTWWPVAAEEGTDCFCCNLGRKNGSRCGQGIQPSGQGRVLKMLHKGSILEGVL